MDALLLLNKLIPFCDVFNLLKSKQNGLSKYTKLDYSIPHYIGQLDKIVAIIATSIYSSVNMADNTNAQ